MCNKCDTRITGIETQYLNFVSSGLCPNCQECANTFGYDNIDQYNQAVECGNLFDESSFSWSPCDDCNTNLGGNSYIAHGIDKNDGSLIHLTICTDCLLEMAGYKWNCDLQEYTEP